MSTPVVDLTPPSADWACKYILPTGATGIVGADSIVITEPYSGSCPLRFFTHPWPNDGRGHGFKMPPTAVTGNVTAINAEFSNEDDETISVSVPVKDAFIANDGRLVFRKGLIPTVLEAIDRGNIGSAYLESVQVEILAELRAVYSNPNGPTPAFAPKNASIYYNFNNEFDFENFENRDLIDEMPFIMYDSATYETPATIGAGPSAM